MHVPLAKRDWREHSIVLSVNFVRREAKKGIHLPQSNERPAHTPSSQIIFHVVRSPAAPLMQLKVISVPVSKPSSESANGMSFLFAVGQPKNRLFRRLSTHHSSHDSLVEDGIIDLLRQAARFAIAEIVLIIAATVLQSRAGRQCAVPEALVHFAETAQDARNLLVRAGKFDFAQVADLVILDFRCVGQAALQRIRFQYAVRTSLVG